MNKTALRNFSVQAKVKLLNAVKQKAYKFGITENKITPLTEGGVIDGRVLREEELKQYQQLVKRIATEGYERIMEEAAYTWFNRFIALRYMEVNDFLPIHLRILSSETEGKSEADALTNITNLVDELDLDRELVYKMQDESNYEDLYQYLIVQQCNKLGEIIPNVFEYISDDMALLLPDNLLNENSVVRDVVSMVNEEDWKNVEVVGWLYQFYISEQKDEVFKNLKKNIKISKKDIGPATQLFTPRWIVEYMVDNSLGRLWLESNPDKNLQESLDYYLEDAEQTDEVKSQLEALKNPNLEVESIKFMDPSCGSGHILVYAFELFYKMYLSRGYLEREIPQLILENNLYGLDIDTRATQLATFAVVMKAREYDRRLFSREYTVHIHSVEESNSISEEELKNFAKENKEVYEETQKLVDTFYDGKLYGSIIQVPEINIGLINGQIKYIQDEAAVDIFTTGLLDYLIPLLKDLMAQYLVLNQKYEVVVTNPPYMGSRGMDPKLSKYVKKNYPDEKSDLFAVFMEVTSNLTKEKFFTATINQHSWMFLSSYEKLRKKLLSNQSIVNMIHLGARTFEEIGGEVVQNTSFVLRKELLPEFNATYLRMVDISNANKKRESFNNTDVYHTSLQKNYNKIPGSPIAYWASEETVNIFEVGQKVDELGDVRQGLIPGNTIEFLRIWSEVESSRIGFNHRTYEDINKYEKKWFPYNKGGSYRKWYGNLEYVINMENNGYDIKHLGLNNNFRLRDSQYYFQEVLTWSKISSGKFSLRYIPSGTIFDIAGCSIFYLGEKTNYTLGVLNSKVSDLIFSLTSPTLNYEVAHIKQFPILQVNNPSFQKINNLVNNNIELSKKEWDSFETSWDFVQHPFLTYKEEASTISDSYNNWEEIAKNGFYQLKENEEELNRIFIDLYELQDELTSEVEEKDVTVRKAIKERDVKSFLSYLVGVIFGRYSLDEVGLAYAGGEWDASKYKTFQPVEDNIIPMTEDGYFERDIVSKLETLLTIIYGEESLEENLHFIAEALNKRKNETDRDRIRRYFTKEFFKDHSRIYQKRPIYWEFSSGRRGAFKGLMYLHRYDRDTVARFRTDYVLAESRTLDNLIMLEEHIVEDENSSTAQKARAEKVIENYQKDKKEVAEYAELLDHVARGRIDLDLDDGVKVNYEKFQKIEIVDNQTGKVKKQDVLSKI